MRRFLRRHAVYVVFASSTIGLSVGATLAVFTIVNALWLRPLPFSNADRVVFLVDDNSHGSTDTAHFSGLEDATHWTAFEAVAGQVATSGYLGPLDPRIVLEPVGHQVETLGITSQYFRVLGLRVKGRDFTRDDDRYGAEPVAIISNRLWSRTFGGRADVIGAVVGANPFPIRIVGVAPAGFEGARHGEQIDLWIPANLVPRVAPVGSLSEDAIPTLALGRLHNGETAADAKRLLIKDAGSEGARRAMEQARLVPIASVFGTPNVRTMIIAGGRAANVVAGLAGLALLAGCTTLMALVLVHYERRREEICIRLALGASPARLAAGMAREVAALGVTGMGGAIFVAVVSLRAVRALSLPGGLDLGRLDLSIDWRVLGAALAMTASTVFAAAAIPVARFARARLGGELVGSTTTPGPSSHRVRQGLLATHVAATVTVLITAALFVRAVAYGFGAGAGFDIQHTVFVEAQLLPPYGTAGLSWDAISTLADTRSRRLEDALSALPGVELVVRGHAPLGPDATLVTRTIEANGKQITLRLGVISGDADMPKALGVPIIRGRAPVDADAQVSPEPSVLTISLARRLWPGEDSIGKVFSQFVSGRWGRNIVVGVAADFAYYSLTDPPAGVLMGASSAGGGSAPAFIVRTRAAAESMRLAIRKRAEDLLPDLPRLVVTTGERAVADDLGRQRLGAWFFSGFGLVALALGTGGVFGLVAYLAETQRREFGIRLALGAQPGSLVRRATAAGVVPVAAGTAVGLGVAALVARGLVSLLAGLSLLDAGTCVSAFLVTIGTAVLAAGLGAWPLREISPSEVLRAE